MLTGFDTRQALHKPTNHKSIIVTKVRVHFLLDLISQKKVNSPFNSVQQPVTCKSGPCHFFCQSYLADEVRGRLRGGDEKFTSLHGYILFKGVCSPYSQYPQYLVYRGRRGMPGRTTHYSIGQI